MRPDVKLGVVISMVLVLVAGTYFIYSDTKEQPIPVVGGPGSPAQSLDRKKETLATRNPSSTTKPPNSRDRKRTPARRPTVNNPPRLAQGDRPQAGSRTEDAGRGIKPRETLADKSPGSRATPPTTRPATAGGEQSKQPDVGQPPASTGTVAQFDAPGERPAADRNDLQPDSARRATSLTATRPVVEPAANAGRRSEAAVETHRIQTGETLTELATRYYGSASYTDFLARSNPNISDPNRLKVGMLVRIPPKPEGRAESTASSDKPAPSASTPAGQPLPAARTYRVKAGDSLYVIAKDVLGDAARWGELFELNKQTLGNDPNRLKVGQTLTLPPK